MIYTKEIFQRLTRGQFLSHNTTDSEAKAMYQDLDENYQEYLEYFKMIGLVLVKGYNYFHFTREMDEVKAEDKLRGLYSYIDYLDILYDCDPRFDIGRTLSVSMIENKVGERKTLQDKLDMMISEKGKPDTTYRDAILDIFKDMTNKGFFELVNKNTDTYIVTDAFAYIRDVVDMLTPKSDTYDETAQ